MKFEEGICPLCSKEFEYTGVKKNLDDGGTNGWQCPHCGASGEEGFSYTFDGAHYLVVCKPRDVVSDIMYGAEGICPVCQDRVEYAGTENDDDGRMCDWCCPGCEASGSEGNTEKFDGTHYNVVDKAGTPISLSICRE